MRFSLPRISTAIAAGALMVSLGGAAEEPKAGATPTPDKDGFVSLFDGKSLDGWKIGDNADSWSVKDGLIVVHGKGPAHLFYDGPIHNHDWKNFHLKSEVMTFPHANSGIYFHTEYQEKGWPAHGFEAQVNCTHGDKIKTGSLYHISDIPDPHHKDNEWFLYEIIVQGKHVVLKIDGKVVNDWTQPEDFTPVKGHPLRFISHGTIALQGHDPGSEVHFKSVVIKPLDE
jgi:hypothetical protein